MATLDDKLLGEKLQNYCSSSSEDEDEKDNDYEEKSKSSKSGRPKFIPESEIKEKDREWCGTAQNTGPKGVIKDWQRFKQLENEKNQESQKERLEIAKKLAFTCRSDDLDKELDKEKQKENNQQQQNEMSMEDLEKDLLQDVFFQEYLKKKMEEMNQKLQNLPKFGKVIELSNEMFLDEIDKENKNVTIIVHIYDQKIPECRMMNNCLDEIAKDYLIVKFCKVKSTEINLSDKFRKMGCPALLIYKHGELIGNFVKMNDEFGDEFCSSDVENFLLEQGYLPSTEISSIRNGTTSKNQATNNGNYDDDDDDDDN